MRSAPNEVYFRVRLQPQPREIAAEIQRHFILVGTKTQAYPKVGCCFIGLFTDCVDPRRPDCLVREPKSVPHGSEIELFWLRWSLPHVPGVEPQGKTKVLEVETTRYIG